MASMSAHLSVAGKALPPDALSGSGLRSLMEATQGGARLCKNAQGISRQRRILLTRSYLKNSTFSYQFLTIYLLTE